MRKKHTIILLTLIAAIAVGGPWIAAYQGDRATRYHYGDVNGLKLECVAVDGTHFDRYQCLVLDDANSQRVNYAHGKVLLDGKPVRFPPGQNVGWLSSDGQLKFSMISSADIKADSGSNSEVYYIFGKVPKFKKISFGVPRIEVLKQRFQI